jgi:VWFA-related protein
MRSTHGLLSIALLAAVTTGVSAQQRAAAPTPPDRPSQEAERPTFSLQIDLVTTDVIARDRNGDFIPDLTKEEFEIFEDGVKQDIASMTLSHGGRVTNLLAPAPPAPAEGIILPPARRTSDTSTGRVFIFYVDDLHLQFQNTIRVRELFSRISKTLVHEGDLFGIVSSGPSAISVDLTYDRKRLDEAAGRIMGSELRASEIINSPGGGEGPAEVRHRAHEALGTLRDLLDSLEQKVRSRRKALVFVSDGYDFAPFQQSRLGLLSPDSPFLQNRIAQTSNAAFNAEAAAGGGSPNGSTVDPHASAQQVKEEFADADLAMELAEITRTANRANATIYTIDPRGVIAAPDVDEPVDAFQWHDFIDKSQSTLRTLADETGGFAVIDENDFDSGLKRIDADTSDYYVLGYYSRNPPSLKRFRQLDVRVLRNGATVSSRKEYMAKPLATRATPPASPASPARPVPSARPATP